MPNVLIPLADGVEEMEGVIITDVLRRAEWEVTTAGVTGEVITASRGVRWIPDRRWDDIQPADFDWIILPGGLPGTQKLMADQRVLAALQAHVRAGRWLGAICAAPAVLHAAGLLTGKRVTSHPSVAERLGDAQRLHDPVVVDGRLVTSQGPGTCFAFALKIVALIDGEAKARQLAEAMIYGPYGAD